MAKQAKTSIPVANPETTPRTVAAIDIGSNTIRMVVAQVLSDNRLEYLERTQRAVRLGQDTFLSGRLGQKTMNAAITILRDFRRILDTYGVKCVRAVATSSVREASNADAFLDRILMATNLEVEVIDPSEEIRLTVDAVRTALSLRRSSGGRPSAMDKSLIADIGGGSALLTVLEKGEILASGTYQLGSIRLQELLSTSQEPPLRAAELLRHQIANVVAAVRSSLPLGEVKTFIAVGGDARFAAQQILSEGPAEGAGGEAGAVADQPSGAAEAPQVIAARQFDAFVARCSVHTAEELATTYQIPFANSETLVPALLAYQALLHETQAKRIVVPNVSMRDGLMLDLARSITGGEDPELYASTLDSARAIAEKYHVDPAHTWHVADLAVELFDHLQAEHGLGPRQRLLLRVAAILHEVGGFVSSRAHHKHSYYLVANSEIFGLQREETQIVALVARYHRRSLPNKTHPDYMALPREARMVVSKLAAILRVADALDRGHSQQIRNIQIEREAEDFIIYVRGVPDLTLERRALEDKADLFEDIFGMKVRLEEGQEV
ncbi:MAG: Ppx/GppA phosphatase family protein [Phycisphaerae bacterium]|jgi:exopolyphosphatase/guanosine-5'-triphosphate,3'-diphosphate pyrophosphatase